MPQLKVRGAMTVLHRWTGLLIALFLGIVGLTGSILAFQMPIDRMLNPELHASNPQGRAVLDLATLAERVEAAYPHIRPAYFEIEDDQVSMMVSPRTDPATGKPFPLEFENLTLDPWTGNVLGSGGMENDWTSPGSWRKRILPFVYSLHTSLATNTSTGWMMVGVVALLWTIDCFVAFTLTLPRGSGSFWLRWRQAWKVKWNANSSRIHFDLHRAGGLWLWPLLFVFGWSSVMLGLTQVYEPVMKALFPYVSVSESVDQNSLPKPLEDPAITWRHAQTLGQQAMADLAAKYNFTVERPYGLAYVSPYGAYTYCVRSSLDFRGHGWDTSVLIDGMTGKVRSFDLPRRQHLGNTISVVLWGIHYGDLRDWLPYRILIVCLGVFLAVLAYTGVFIWWRKRNARRATRRTAIETQLQLKQNP